MSRMKKFVVPGLLLVGAGVLLPLQAQTIRRCGTDGRSFSDRPCTEGRRLQMAELADLRSAQEVLAAQEVAARQQRLADALRQERLQREREAAPPFDPPAATHGRHGGADFNAKREAKRQREEARRPSQGHVQRQRQRISQPPTPAADGTWRAVAPSSPRSKD